MARKLVKRAAREASSDLSSAPSDTEVAPKDIPAAVAAAPKGTKRKRATKPVPTATPAIEKAEEELDATLPPAKRNRRAQKPATYTEAENGDEDEDEVAEGSTAVAKPKPQQRAPRKKKTVEVKEEQELEEEDGPAATKTKAKKATVKAKVTKVTQEVQEGEEKKPVKKRKTKEEKEAEAMPIAARSAIGNKMVIGAHVSAAGGVQNAVSNALYIGANAFALFLKSQRTWKNPDLKDDIATSFLDNCKKHEYKQDKHVVPHGSYLVNLAATDEERTKQAYESFLDDLKRCERLGITLYNFHPGNALTADRSKAITHLASNLNRAHKETSTVVTLLENMAAGGNVLGSTFEDLGEIISQVEDKSRVGVCLDTCHAFAGGYDLRTKDALDATLTKFDKTVGLKYLRALHLNDSKAPFESYRDLHANIGTGFLGLRAFHAIMNEERFWGLPGVLETPIDVRDDDGVQVKDEKGKDKEDKGIWATEIKLLESLVGMDTETEAFSLLEEALSRKGKPERERIAEQVEKRELKAELAANKVKKKEAKKGAATKTAKEKGNGKNKKRAAVKSESEEEDGSDLSELDDSASD